MSTQPQNMGSMNVITGVATRVAAPVQETIKLNTELSQKYWQNQQQNIELNKAVKNIQTLDDIDKQHVENVSNYINDRFKQTVSTGNWENATSAVMDAANKVSTDEALKAVQANYAAYHKGVEDLEKRYEKEPALRKYSAYYKWASLQAYKQQGGAMKDGKSQSFTMQSPQTNMDITDDLKRIDDAVSKVHAITSSQFANQKYIDKSMLSQVTDETSRAILAQTLLQEDKISVESLTKDRLEDAAKKQLAADPMFTTKLHEIARAEHWQSTGGTRDNVTSQDLINHLKNLGGGQEKALALNLSDSFKAAVKKLNSKYGVTDADHLSQAQYKSYKKEYSAIGNDQRFIDEGLNKLTQIASDKIEAMYYSSAVGIKYADIIKTADKYAYSKTDMTRHYGSADKLLDVLAKQKADSGTGLFGSQDVASGTLELDPEMFNPKSDVNRDFAKAEAAYNAAKATGKISPTVELAYKNALNIRNAQLEMALTNYDHLDKDEQSKVRFAASSIFDNDSREMFGNSFSRGIKHLGDSFTSALKKGFAAGSGNPVIINKVLSEEIHSKFRNEAFSKLTARDLLAKSNDEIYQNALKGYDKKYFTPSDEQSFKRSLDNFRSRMVSSLNDHYKSTNKALIVPYTREVTIGPLTKEASLLRYSVISSLQAGALTDVNTGKVISMNDPDYANIGMPKKDSKNNSVDISSLSNVTVERVNTHGALKGNIFDITIPEMIEDPAHKGSGKMISSGRTRQLRVRYDGDASLVNAASMSQVNKLREEFTRVGGDKALAVHTAANVMNNMGMSYPDSKGIPMSEYVKDMKNRPVNTYNKSINFDDSNDNLSNSRAWVKVQGIAGKYHVTMHIQGQPEKTVILNKPDDFASHIGLIDADSKGLDQTVKSYIEGSLYNH